MLQCDVDVLFAFIASIRNSSPMVACSPPTGWRVCTCCQVNEGVTDGSKDVHAHAFAPIHGITTAKPACQSFIPRFLHPVHRHLHHDPRKLSIQRYTSFQHSIHSLHRTDFFGTTCLWPRKPSVRGPCPPFKTTGGGMAGELYVVLILTMPSADNRLIPLCA